MPSLVCDKVLQIYVSTSGNNNSVSGFEWVDVTPEADDWSDVSPNSSTWQTQSPETNTWVRQ